MSVVVQTDKTVVVHAPSGTVLVGQVIGGGGVAADWDALANKPLVIAAGNNQQEARDAIALGTAAIHNHEEYATAAQGSLADSAIQAGAGLGALDAAANTKLAGIAAGATANDTNAQLRDRATHTGTQPMATIGDKQGKVLDDPVIVSDGDIDSLMTPGGYLLDANPANSFLAGCAVLVSAVDGYTFQQAFLPILGIIQMRYHDGAAWQPFVSSVTRVSMQLWYDNTTAEAANAVINADGTLSRSIATYNPNPLLVVSGASHAFVKADVNKYARYTAAGAKAATFDSGEGFAVGDAFHITNRAASGNITISGTGVTLNTPKNGTLVLEPKDTVTVKFISPTEADVMGSVVAA